jgi:hypothetical protein
LAHIGKKGVKIEEKKNMENRKRGRGKTVKKV